jgi:hypothetical protein
MNPHWPGYQALKRGNDVFADSAMGSIILKTKHEKLSALMKFIQKTKIFRKVSTSVWRVEYQKRGVPHAHILFWSDFDTQDVHAVETVINVKYPNDSRFPDDKGMVTNFRQLIASYQIHHHSERCQLPSGKYRFRYPQTIINIQDSVATTICLPVMTKKRSLSLAILCCWPLFGVITVSK